MRSIVERCKEILEYRRCQVVDFHEENYMWSIGANCLNELINESNIRYVPFNRRKNIPTLFGIEYVLQPDNNCLELVRKDSGTKYNDSDKIDAMRYTDAVNPYFNFTPLLKNNFMNWKSKLKCVIKKVIFNDPATIVFWDDGMKTVVKAENEPFDPEKGLAMAIAKKALGNKGDYYNEFKKWLPEKEEVDELISINEHYCYDCKYAAVKSNEDPCHDCLKHRDTLPHFEKRETKKTVDKGVDDCYYTVKELSEIFNISRDKVRNNIKNGLYPNAIKQSGAWLIPYNDFKSMLSKKNCSTCEYVKSPVSPYDDPLHPCNLCDWEKADD